MGKLTKLYRHSGWYETFNLSTEGGRARTALLASRVPQAVVSGFSSGVFYTGLLIGHGIDIVNISILTMIPYIASLLSIFTPYILNRFPRRRFVLSAARVCYYLVNIVGITLLPELVHDQTARIWGLIGIVFTAHAINFLFEGYNAWHIPYIVPAVRNNYFTATTLVTNISGSLVLYIASAIADSVQGEARLTLITVMRYISFAVAMLDVYLLQKPKEPDYAVSGQPKLLDVFRKPLADKTFRLAMLLLAAKSLISNLSGAAMNVWLLEEVGVSYMYITVIDSTFFLFVMLTSPLWNRVMRRLGSARTYALVLAVDAVAVIAYAFVSGRNYIWLMGLVRLTQHFISMGISFGSNGLLYDSLPQKDQTAHLSFYTLSMNLAVFLGMTLGTWIIAGMGSDMLHLFGAGLSGVPVLLLLQGILLGVLAAAVLLLRKKIEPNR